MIRRLLSDIEARALRTWNFCANVCFFLRLGYSLRRSIHLAGNTL